MQQVEQITYDGVLTVIYAVRADDPSPHLGFTCHPGTFPEVRLLDDGDGKLATSHPMDKSEPYRLFGYSVDIDKKHSGLAFGRIK